MQLSDAQIRKAWEQCKWQHLDVLAHNFPEEMRKVFAREIEAAVLRAQADARPLAWMPKRYVDILREGKFVGGFDEDLIAPMQCDDCDTPLYTHPEASAQPMCVKCGDGIMAHDPGTCGNCHAIGAEASAPGLSDEARKLIQYAAEFIGGAVNYGQNAPDEPPGPVSQWDYDAHYLAQGLQALLTRASAATQPNEADE